MVFVTKADPQTVGLLIDYEKTMPGKEYKKNQGDLVRLPDLNGDFGIETATRRAALYFARSISDFDDVNSAFPGEFDSVDDTHKLG